MLWNSARYLGRHSWVTVCATRPRLAVVIAGLMLLPFGLDARRSPLAADAPTSSAAEQRQAAERELAALLTGSTWTGTFTIDGQPNAKHDESYAIESAEKQTGSLWLLKSRMKFGDVDATVPVPITIVWADETPMMQLKKVTLPGLGTFSCRILIDGDRYAGTWQHDAVGGHMFGKITRTPAASEK